METDVASSTPVPSALRRTGRLATVTTTAKLSCSGLVSHPERRLLSMPGGAVLDRAVGRCSDLHQPAWTGESRIEAVPRKGGHQKAVHRPPRAWNPLRGGPGFTG